MSKNQIDLGFAEPCEPWRLQSRLFPSKIGGKPAWLSLENIPDYDRLKCATCNKTVTFLCQIYAPIEEDPANFHRTVYVFACRTPTCNLKNKSENFKVLRDSLPRRNKFYSYDPPEEKPDEIFDPNKWTRLCNFCGCAGDKTCSKCKKVGYCSREHQVLDWKDKHKNDCVNSNLNPSEESNVNRIEKNKPKSLNNMKYLYPEMEIIIEPEEVEEKVVDEEAELKNLKEWEKENESLDVTEEELQAHVAIKKDKAFMRFKKKIQDYPDQILRYDRSGQPLWIAEEPLPFNIPRCKACGGERHFEFQIMPQLLSVLKESILDWGVLAVYTCSNSCTSDGYKTEYIFKQDVSEDVNE